LRRKQIHGVRFRRQYPLGPYFADFVCFAARVIVEVDGSSHLDAAQIVHDRIRTQWLDRHGFKVIRFWNLDVLTNIDPVMERINREVAIGLQLRGNAASPR
jgi:adenine-specific DNA-methyltransferase